jgi:hypothetical protein
MTILDRLDCSEQSEGELRVSNDRRHGTPEIYTTGYSFRTSNIELDLNHWELLYSSCHFMYAVITREHYAPDERTLESGISAYIETNTCTPHMYVQNSSSCY